MQEELKRWESKSCKVTAGFNAAPSSGGGADKVQNCVEKILEVKDKIVAQIMQGATLRINIDHAINSVPDERLRQLLSYRYIDGMKWESIAVEMNYSWQHLHKMHSTALLAIVCDTQPVL